VLISASGRSAETLDRAARLRVGTQRIALVNDITSELAEGADVVVDMVAGPEDGQVACRTYRHTLALLLAMGIDRHAVASAVEEAARRTSQLLEQRDWLTSLDSALDGSVGSFWLAPEARIGSALQSALMIREVPRRLAVACETGEWSHVDVYLSLTLDYRCVIFTGSTWDRQAAAWLSKRGSTVVTVGDPLGIPGEIHVPLPGSPVVRMLVEPVLAELLSLAWWRRDPVEVP
jgi:fructoselysine-6-P-deglycase FrlB-like protein